MSDPVAVVGAGAIGSLLAALLHRAEVDTCLVARGPSLAAMRTNGVEVKSQQYGRWRSDVPVVAEVPKGSDVLLAVKTPHLNSLVGHLAKRNPSSVMLLQNGIEHVDLIRGEMNCPVLPGAIYVEAVKDGADVVLHRTDFTRVMVSDDQLSHPMPTRLRDAGVEVVGSEGESATLWHKFVFLAPTALLTSYFRAPLGEAVEMDQSLTRALAEEVAGTATSCGVPTTPDDVLLRLKVAPAAMRSSLQRDLEQGGSSELDAIGGALVRAAARAGVPSPIAQMIVSTLERRR